MALIPSAVQNLRRRGAVAPFVAVSLTGMLGILALVCDAGQLYEDRRHVQAAADAAAMAGCADLYTRWKTNSGQSDPSDNAKTSALHMAALNGFTDGVNNVTVTVTFPAWASSPASAGSPAKCKVVITCQQARYFSQIWGTSNTTVVASATAAANYYPFADGIIALNPTKQKALDANGSGSNALVVKNAAILVNSNDSTKAADTVGNAKIEDSLSTIQVNGGWSGSFYDTSGNVITPIHGPQIPDPLAYLPAPSSNTAGTHSSGYMVTTKTVSGGSTTSLTTNGASTIAGLGLPAGVPNSTGTTTIGSTTYIVESAQIYTQGTYSGNDLHFTGNETAFFMPGNYIISGNTGFSMGGNGNVGGNNVMIYANQFSITGNGYTALNAPSSGTYQGILYFQDRSSTSTSAVAGNGKMNVTGTIYVRSGEMDVAGNGDLAVAGQIIADTIKNNGNATANVVYNAQNNAKASLVRLIE